MQGVHNSRWTLSILTHTFWYLRSCKYISAFNKFFGNLIYYNSLLLYSCRKIIEVMQGVYNSRWKLSILTHTFGYLRSSKYISAFNKFFGKLIYYNSLLLDINFNAYLLLFAQLRVHFSVYFYAMVRLFLKNFIQIKFVGILKFN